MQQAVMQSRLKRAGWFALLALVALASAPLINAQSKGDKGGSAAPEMVEADYIIGPLDALSVSVWREADFTGTLNVRPDGKISMPLIGDVQAAGLTPMQLSASITEKLRKYVSEPRVTVVVNQATSHRFFIMGEVNRGGAFPLPPNTTVLQGLASAGGFTQMADTKKIYLLRKENGKEVKFPFNYREVLKGKHTEQNVILKPGDTIVVP